MNPFIKHWVKVLNLSDWSIKIEHLPFIFEEDVNDEDKFYVDTVIGYNEAVIYHEKDLIEEEALRQLLHIKFPDLNADLLDLLTDLFLNAKDFESGSV